MSEGGVANRCSQWPGNPFRRMQAEMENLREHAREVVRELDKSCAKVEN